jgi:hypothetical protein
VLRSGGTRLGAEVGPDDVRLTLPRDDQPVAAAVGARAGQQGVVEGRPGRVRSGRGQRRSGREQVEANASGTRSGSEQAGLQDGTTTQRYSISSHERRLSYRLTVERQSEQIYPIVFR